MTDDVQNQNTEESPKNTAPPQDDDVTAQGDQPQGDVQAQSATANIYRPEGIPEHFLGESDHQTIDNVLKAYKGARDELAGKNGIPESFDDYTLPLTEDQQEQFLVKNEEGVDPVFERLRKKAFENGVPADKAFDMITSVYELAKEVDTEKADHEEAVMTEFNEKYGAPDTEFSGLGGPEKAKPMQDAANAWLDAQEKSGALSDVVAKELRAIMNYEQGLLVVEAMRTMSGERPIPKDIDGGSPSGELGLEKLHEMQRDPRYWREKDPAFIDKVTEGYEKIYGDNAA